MGHLNLVSQPEHWTGSHLGSIQRKLSGGNKEEEVAVSGWRSGKSSQGGRVCQEEGSGAEIEKEAQRGLRSWSIYGFLVLGVCRAVCEEHGEVCGLLKAGV